MVKKTNKQQVLKHKINEAIKADGDVRVVGDNIESKVVPIEEAMSMADEMGLDLVLLREGDVQSPPIIRICDYEKMMYAMKKEAKRRAANASKPMKEIQLSVNIAKNDLETKARSARKFLGEGSKVKVVLTMRGRELGRREESQKSLLEFIVMLEDEASIEGEMKAMGNKTVVILKPKK